MVDRTNYIWSASNLQHDFIVLMTKLVAYFRICLYMVDRTKRLASVGLAQARPNYFHATCNLFLY